MKPTMYQTLPTMKFAFMWLDEEPVLFHGKTSIKGSEV